MTSTLSVHSPLVSVPWDLKSRDSLALSQNQPQVPKNFVWERNDIGLPKEKLNAPVIDLECFFKGDALGIERACEQLRVACEKHGFFQVINHKVDPALLNEAYDCLDDFFKLPMERKLKAQKQHGVMWGFALAHSERFSTNLPWKETFSFNYIGQKNPNTMVLDYFTSAVGSDLEHMGMVYQKYCTAMHEYLSLSLMELLAISLGAERNYYREFYEDASSTMRCNYYPPCDDPSQVLGTGPHCDPTSLTVLYQDQFGGLEVFDNGKWLAIEPRADALVINIGDTFTAISNGKYKSCLRRAVVNKTKERKSMAFFLNPRWDKVVKPPQNLTHPTRNYPYFTWSDFLGFTQNHYRSDAETLNFFIKWFTESKSDESIVH